MLVLPHDSKKDASLNLKQKINIEKATFQVFKPFFRADEFTRSCKSYNYFFGRILTLIRSIRSTWVHSTLQQPTLLIHFLLSPTRTLSVTQAN